MVELLSATCLCLPGLYTSGCSAGMLHMCYMSLTTVQELSLTKLIIMIDAVMSIDKQKISVYSLTVSHCVLDQLSETRHHSAGIN